ncbi:unnamed protein product [Lampetra planeri]
MEEGGEGGTASAFLDSVLCCLLHDSALCAQPCPEHSRGTLHATAAPWEGTTPAAEGRTPGRDSTTLLPLLLVLGLLALVALGALGCWFAANAERLLVRGRRTPVNVVKPCRPPPAQASHEGAAGAWPPVSSATPVSVTA